MRVTPGCFAALMVHFTGACSPLSKSLLTHVHTAPVDAGADVRVAVRPHTGLGNRKVVFERRFRHVSELPALPEVDIVLVGLYVVILRCVGRALDCTL